jgi:transposase InsO family protein
MYGDVFQYAKRCQICQEYNQPTTVPKGHTFPVAPPKQPFHTVGIDFIGPFPKCGSQQYALVFICHTTRYVGAISVSKCDSEKAVRALEKYLILVHSCPKRIVLDQGTHFTSQAFKAFAAKYNIELVFGPAYHHQHNGIVERANGTIKRTLAKRIKDAREWAKHLHEIVYAINITVHVNTKFSPFRLLYGYDPNLPIDNKLPTISENIDDDEHFARERRHEAMIPAVVANTVNTVESQQKEKAKYDIRHPKAKFEKGDLVWQKKYDIRPGEVKKFNASWKGPFIIVDASRNFTVKLKTINQPRERKFDASVTQLKPHFPENVLSAIPENEYSECESINESDSESVLTLDNAKTPPNSPISIPDPLVLSNPSNSHNEESQIPNNSKDSSSVSAVLNPLPTGFYVLCAPSTAPRHLRPSHLRPVNCAPSTAPRHLRPSQMRPTSNASESTAPHIKICMCTVVYKVSSKISMFHYKPYRYVYTNALKLCDISAA